jgi:subtilisin family serine protease
MTPISPDEARDALERGTGAGVRLAIIDSGVEVGHPNLAGLELADDVAIANDGVRLTAVPGEGRDVYGHGTAIASIVKRIAPDVTLGSFRVLDAGLGSRTAIIREGVRQAIDRGYQILNCSFGCRGEAKYVMQYKDWVDESYLKRIHVIAACNNFDVTVPEWPGHFPTVITVNMARTAGLAFFYSAGNLVEFAAAGDRVEVAWKGGEQKTVTGSSYAAPHVAGLLARLLSVHPDVSPLEAKALLHRIAEPLRNDVAGSNVLSGTMPNDTDGSSAVSLPPIGAAFIHTGGAYGASDRGYKLASDL